MHTPVKEFIINEVSIHEKNKIKKVFKIVSCILLCVAIVAGTVAFIVDTPEKREPVFAAKKEKSEKEKYDDGKFEPQKYDLIVSPNGNDKNPGTLKKPLKTLQGAKNKLKNLKLDEKKNVTVWFKEGTYPLLNTVKFDSTDRKNVVYRSIPGEKVIFSGSKEISNFSETKINNVKAFVSDVEINDENDVFRSLYKNEKRLSRSIYPKEGSFKVKSIDKKDIVFSNSDFDSYAAFYTEATNLNFKANLNDIDVKLMHYWADEYLPIVNIDKNTGRIETARATALTVNEDENFIFINVKEALSLPGEWYLDKAEEKLYYIPQEGDTIENTVLRAGVNETLVEFDGTEDITFRSIEFCETNTRHKDGGMYVNEIDKTHTLYKNLKYTPNHPQAAYDISASVNVYNSSSIDFIHCQFKNTANSGLKYGNGAKNSLVETCFFDNTGANGVVIMGDDTIPAKISGITVNDCHIRNYGREHNNAIGILLTHATDCVFTNNEIHDGWYTAISIGWRWGYNPNPTDNIKVSNNLIYNIGNGWLSDMGGIYTLGMQPHTILSENIIYNVGCYDGDSGYGGWGIYLDEGSSEITVEKNLVYDCSSQTFHQHYGKDNMIKNNIFAFGGDGQFKITRREDHNSLYLYNNILVGEDTPMYFETTGLDWFKDGKNTYWDYATRGKTVHSGESTNIFKSENILAMKGRSYYNEPTFADPLFKDAENRDFTLAENSPAFDTGFTPWEYRAGTTTEF